MDLGLVARLHKWYSPMGVSEQRGVGEVLKMGKKQVESWLHAPPCTSQWSWLHARGRFMQHTPRPTQCTQGTLEEQCLRRHSAFWGLLRGHGGYVLLHTQGW
ncbi:hypothetical protein DR999_PMT07310 [Platysternon megacephalum]|uniref:Uncharacterized protein n=1 Tax=Platysternon megacephalum TaxID=55544 RepID=A0A4D9EQT1_9SAUR|nr:hypothetical protein DR999_PMT07310 [Platysternon megacephalum]